VASSIEISPQTFHSLWEPQRQLMKCESVKSWASSDFYVNELYQIYAWETEDNGKKMKTMVQKLKGNNKTELNLDFLNKEHGRGTRMPRPEASSYYLADFTSTIPVPFTCMET
jgi:ribosomal protein L35AE/L33A